MYTSVNTTLLDASGSPTRTIPAISDRFGGAHSSETPHDRRNARTCNAAAKAEATEAPAAAPATPRRGKGPQPNISAGSRGGGERDGYDRDEEGDLCFSESSKGGFEDAGGGYAG